MPKKKKKSSSNETKNADLLVDLKGIGLVLIALIGCLPFGIVAEVIRGFAAFLVGDWWALLLILVGICGLYMIFTRKKPVFLTAKLLGLYIIIFAVLTMSHLSFLKEHPSFKFSDTPKILDETSKNRFRSKNDVNQYLFANWQMASGNFFPRKTSIGKFFRIGDNNKKIVDTIRRGKYKLICLNDSSEISDFETAKQEINGAFEERFPFKSSYEL